MEVLFIKDWQQTISQPTGRQLAPQVQRKAKGTIKRFTKSFALQLINDGFAISIENAAMKVDLKPDEEETEDAFHVRVAKAYNRKFFQPTK